MIHVSFNNFYLNFLILLIFFTCFLFKIAVISRETWEWIGLATILIIVLCVIPCLYCCWKRGVEREMALSLRLLDD